MSVEKILLKANIGDKEITISIDQPSGSNGTYYIMIDKFYYGAVVPDVHEGWRVALQNEGNPEWMSEDDKAVIVEAVKSRMKI